MTSQELAPPLYVIELPGYVTPTLNVTQRLHWSRRRQVNKALAWQIRCAHRGALPAVPLPHARVEIERRSIGEADTDGLIGGFKGLLDCLQPVSKRHPHGLGFIADDSPRCLTLIAKPIRVRTRVEQGVTVRIWSLPASI